MNDDSNKTIRLRFDGGCNPNPGKAYGSYQADLFDTVLRGERIDFGDGMTNNIAEYMAMIFGLIDILGELGGEAPGYRVLIETDSELVNRQLQGKWKVKNDRMRQLLRISWHLLDKFSGWEIRWQGRENNVALFGH